MGDQQTMTTTDHDEIRRWAEDHEAVPATARGTQQAGEAAGVLTLDVVGYGADEDSLEHVSWDDWFEKFEESELAFVYQATQADGEPSTFFRLVARG